MKKLQINEKMSEFIHLTPFSSGSFFQFTGIEPTSLPIQHFTYKLPKKNSYVKWGKGHREKYLEELTDILTFNCVSYNKEMKRLGFLCPYNLSTVYRDIESISLYLFNEHLSSEKKYKGIIQYDILSLSNENTFMDAIKLYEIEYDNRKGNIHFYKSIKVDGELERVIFSNSKDKEFVYGEAFLDRYGTSRGSVRNICSKLGIRGKYESSYELGREYRVIKKEVAYSTSEYVEEDFDIDEYLSGMDLKMPMSSKWLDRIHERENPQSIHNVDKMLIS